MAASKKPQAAVKASNARNTLKNLFYAGIGLAEETNKSLHQKFNSLVKKGKVHEPEVKKAVEDIRRKALARRKELEKKFSDLIKENELVKSKEFQTLLKRLESLEVAPKGRSVAKKAK